IDRLARRGVLYTNAHASAPLCGPSRESLLTGREPFHLEFFTQSPAAGRRRPRELLTTLPELFRASGYRTLGVGKIFHGGYEEPWDEYGPGTGVHGGPFT